MKVNSFNTEFGYELIAALPYAYHLHINGLLSETESAVDTKCLYYFSENHKENKTKRSFYNTPKAKQIPNIDIHKPYLHKSKFLPPPLKEQYANDRFKFKQETIVICNRINKEWGKEPINYFDIDTLRKLFKKLHRKYQIVYINVEGKPELYDNAPPITIGDYDLIQNEFSKTVINIHDLHKENSELTFNELQLMVFANCQKFITMNGGHSILASYFGGENIIMSKYGNIQAQELDKNINSFYRWYNEFGGSRIIHVENETKLLSKINSLWAKKYPICNILVRTTNRPHAFAKCMESIYKQTYENINVFVSFETIEDYKYIIPEKCYAYKVQPETKINIAPNTNEYGVKFHSNLYLNDLQKQVKSGFVIYLDDDDILTGKDAIANIAKQMQSNELLFWRVKIGERIVPNENNFKKEKLVAGDISGIGFAFNAKYINSATWQPYKLGDYRVAKRLNETIHKTKFVDDIYTRTQNKVNGSGKKLDNGVVIPNTIILPEIMTKETIKKMPRVIGYVCKMPNGITKNFTNNKHTQNLLRQGLLKIIKNIHE